MICLRSDPPGRNPEPTSCLSHTGSCSFLCDIFLLSWSQDLFFLNANFFVGELGPGPRAREGVGASAQPEAPTCAPLEAPVRARGARVPSSSNLRIGSETGTSALRMRMRRTGPEPADALSEGGAWIKNKKYTTFRN